MTTSRDVARLAGVSQATVSRVLSSTGKVSDSTVARVLKAVQELGYVPHAGAQAMKTRRTNTVGVVVAELGNSFYAEVLDELTRVLAGAGLRVVVWNAGGGSHADALAAISESAVDGVVFTTATATSPELEAAVAAGKPLVLINRDVVELDCDRVISRNRSGGAEVADYLIDHDRADCALIAGFPQATTSNDRSDGFLDRMVELGHEVPEHRRHEGGFSHDVAAQITRRLMKRADRPRAIFCVNDNMAFGALDTLREMDINAEECWVIGYDDVEIASWPSFDLTTIRQPSREMAAAGARLLIERIAAPDLEPRTELFTSALIVRASTQGARRTEEDRAAQP